MKKFKWLSFAVMGALACTMASCSDDEPGGAKNEQEQGNGFYASVTLQLPTAMGSRADDYPKTDTPSSGNDPAQSKDGYETGKDYENAVNSMVVILATGTGATETTPPTSYTYVTSAEGTRFQTGTDKKDQPTFVMQFNASELQDYAQGGTKAAPLYIFAFCNPTTTLKTNIAAVANGEMTFDNLVDKISNPNNPAIAQQNQFMMTSAEIRSHTISKTWEELETQCNTASTAYDLTSVTTGTGESATTTQQPVRVERTSCRFDFMSTTNTINGTQVKDIYPIKDILNENSPVYARVQIKALALFNEQKTFYAIRHASDNGTTGTPSTLCGTETPTNYIISPVWNGTNKIPDDATNIYGPTTDILNTYISNNLFLPIATVTTDNTTDWKTVEEIAGNDPDTDGSSQKPTWDFENTDYHIWRYATENPLPQNKQYHAVTTGVVFKAEILPAPGTPAAGLPTTLAEAMKKGETIYAYNEEPGHENSANNTKIYGTAKDMYDYCASNQNTTDCADFVKAVLNKVFTISISEGGNSTEVTLPAYTAGSEVSDELFEKAAAAIFPTLTTGQSIVIGLNTGAKNNSVLKKYHLMCYVSTNEGTTDAPDYHYYCYYYYYNRHNDNGKSNKIGPMEFATVRNNIYKLKVDDVLTIGLPQDTPPDPWIPDENPKVYFKVSVKVLDWVVRKNNIIF